MREFLTELRDHWDDGYWWADHQLLAVVLAALATGTISLTFKFLELQMEAHFHATR